jgi:hypothetical protein
MFALIGWALISISLSGMTAAAEPYGPSGVLGPAGASTRSCSGAPNNCYVCTPGSCTPSGSWQSVIEGADPGATVLLRAGTYDPSGTLDIPAGTAKSRRSQDR